MKAFVVKLSELLKISRSLNDVENFDEDIIGYTIPKYQREYKWERTKVNTLINDISKRDKFLGNTILDKKEDCYEIVDGQQRFTTILLILVALFNELKSDVGQEINPEQYHILEFLKRGDVFVLENQSVGEFLSLNQNVINFDINDEADIYCQKDIFKDLYEAITNEIRALENKNDFINKLLDCLVLVLINYDTTYNNSIEQIFLDINFKSQHLEVEDIFKGYCFKNYRPAFHNELKDQWSKLRQNSRTFLGFGYKDLNELLYHYFLSKRDSYDISENLSPAGVHYLEGKNNTETKQILDDIVSYSDNIVSFRNNLNQEDYAFFEVCPDMYAYRNTREHVVIKTMCKDILDNKSAQYHKFPFLMLIHYLKKDLTFGQGLSRVDFKKLITNYYIYSFLFINDNRRKQKASIDHTVLDILYDDLDNRQTRIVEAVKILRDNYKVDFMPPGTFSLEKAYTLYSIIDDYISASNFLPKIYSLNTGFNREHLIIHDNRGQRIRWVYNEQTYDFKLTDIIGRNDISAYKKNMINYLIMDEETNATMEHDDIVTKIVHIERTYGPSIPKHIKLFVDHIKGMGSFAELEALKEQAFDSEVLTQKYVAFLNEYFGEENEQQILQKIREAFINAFRNG